MVVRVLIFRPSSLLFRSVRRLILLLLLTIPLFTFAQDTSESPLSESPDEVESSAVETQIIPDTPTLRSVPDTIPVQLKNKKEFAYANDSAWWKKERTQDNTFGNSIENFFTSRKVRTVVYILLALLIVYIVYRVIVVNKLYLFYNRHERKEEGEETKAIFSDSEIQQKINLAISSADYRSAVRFLYIQVLQILDQKKMIRYQEDATNAYYVGQMNPTVHGKIFQYLTQVYEYVWYGKFDLSPMQFEKIHADFKRLKKSFSA